MVENLERKLVVQKAETLAVRMAAK